MCVMSCVGVNGVSSGKVIVPESAQLLENIQSKLKDWVDEMEFCFRF